MNCPYCKYKTVGGSKKGTKPKHIEPAELKIIFCDAHASKRLSDPRSIDYIPDNIYYALNSI